MRIPDPTRDLSSDSGLKGAQMVRRGLLCWRGKTHTGCNTSYKHKYAIIFYPSLYRRRSMSIVVVYFRGPGVGRVFVLQRHDSHDTIVRDYGSDGQVKKGHDLNGDDSDDYNSFHFGVLVQI